MCPEISFSLTLTVLWTSALSGCPPQDTFTPESSALESLECRNDYRTHIHCSWTDDPQIQLSLIHMDPDDHRVSPCVQTAKLSSTEQERVFCRYNTSLFAIGFDDVFFFHTLHSSGISRTFKLMEREDEDQDWNFYHTDQTPPLLTSDLFRQHDQQRSVEIVHDIDKKGSETHTTPTPKEVKSRENKTDLSKMSLNKPEGISEYPVPGPSNLHCVLSGGRNVSCSWDLKTSLAQYMSYTLSYRTHSATLAEWCCVEKVEVVNDGDLLRMVGAFSVFKPGVLQVQLTPTPVTKVIRSYEHIQPACPTNLSVELRGENWILNWTLTTYRTVPLTTELKYWSVLTPEEVKSTFVSDGEMQFVLSEASLQGSSEYRAQVRCSVSAPRRSGWRYAGYPSEWTDPIFWTTRPEPLAPHLAAFLLYFLIATFTFAVSIVAFIVLVVVQKRLREWSMSLPSPVLSEVSEALQNPQRDHFPCCTEVKDPDISSAQIVDPCPPSSTFDLENTWTADGNNLNQETEGDEVILHVGHPCFVSFCPSENVMGIDGTFEPRTSKFPDQVLPHSEGYMPNPATSVGTTQNATQETCCLNVEMVYMNWPKSDLTSPKLRTNPNLLHSQHSLNTNVFHLPSPGITPGRL